MSERETFGSIANCARLWCGSETPARPHAHDVRPEQSTPSPGDAVAKWYGTPSWLMAAATAPAAPAEMRGTDRAIGGLRASLLCCTVLGCSAAAVATAAPGLATRPAGVAAGAATRPAGAAAGAATA